MAFCGKCGKELTDSDKYCPACGRLNTIYMDKEVEREVEAAMRSLNSQQRKAADRMIEDAIFDMQHSQDGKRYTIIGPEERKKIKAVFETFSDEQKSAFYMVLGKELEKYESNSHAKTPETSDTDKRKQHYVGNIKKCPSCGEEITALTAICPACGHELNSVKVSAVLQEFIDNVNECDQRIANAPNPPKTGWASWSKTKRIWWVILNIFTSGIPLVIYLIWPLLKYSSTPKLTADEKQKASLIENFPFPNDRESILEALLFAKSKVAFLATEKVDRKTAYWTRLWSTKAEQLYEKAEIMFNGDPVAKNAMSEIIAQKERVSKTVKFRAIIGAVILIVAIVFAGIRGGAFEIDALGNNVNNSSIPAVYEGIGTKEAEGIYSYQIRNYIGKNAASVGKASGNFLIDDYGNGNLRIVLYTEDGRFIDPNNHDQKKKYTIVGQNITAGSELIVVHQRDSNGNPYSTFVSYQSHDEIILFLAPVGEASFQPTFVEIFPTLDRHKYYVRDYVGRNAASFGISSGDDRIDNYGEGKLRITFSSVDGSYVDVSDPHSLRNYVVVGQDIQANTDLIIQYQKDSNGREYDTFIEYQNYEEINLIVQKLEQPNTVGFEEGTYTVVSIEHYDFAIPNYWKDERNQSEERQFSAENGDSSALLTIRYPEESDDEYDVSFDGLFSDNNNMIAAIESSYFNCSVDGYEVFESAGGVKGILYRFNYTEITGIFSSEERSGLYFCFPSPEDRRWFYVILTKADTVENDTYEKDFITMLEALCEN